MRRHRWPKKRRRVGTEWVYTIIGNGTVCMYCGVPYKGSRGTSCLVRESFERWFAEHYEHLL